MELISDGRIVLEEGDTVIKELYTNHGSYLNRIILADGLYQTVFTHYLGDGISEYNRIKRHLTLKDAEKWFLNNHF